MTDEEILRAHLARWSEPFAWGYADCFMSVFDYCNDLRADGSDHGAEWRRTYCDFEGARRVLDLAGGGLAGMTKTMIEHGWSHVATPTRGVPVCAEFGAEQIGGICLGNGFCAFRIEGRGRIDLRVKVIGAFWK